MTDPTEQRNRRQRDQPAVVKYFGYVMVLVYFALGTIILFTDLLLPNMPQTQKNILGGLLLLYGLFRGYTVFVKSKRRDDV